MNPLFDKSLTFGRVIRIVFGILVISGIIYLIALLRNALLSFLIAWLLTYVMQPFVKFFQYKLCFKSRILSITTVLVTLGLLTTLLIVMVIPSIAAEADRTPELIHIHGPGESHVPLIPHSWMEYLKSNVDFARIMELLSKKNLLEAVKQIAPQLWSILSNTFSILFNITIVFVILLYFIFIPLDYERIVSGWVSLMPERYRPSLQDLAEDVEYSMNHYFRGQSLIVLSVRVLLTVDFKVIGFPLAATLNLFIGVPNLVPYTQAIGIIPTILLSLLRSAETGENFWLIFGMAILVLGIVRCTQGLYLTPRITGKAMGLGPTIILLLLSIWGTILGFIGLIIVLPLATLCLSYYKRFILHECNELDSKSLAHQPKQEEIDSDLATKK